MKNQEFRRYIYYGVTAIIVIAVCTVFAYCVIEKDSVVGVIKLILGILAPIIYGAVLAYLVTPIYNRCVNGTARALSGRSPRFAQKAAKFVGTLVSFVIVVLVFVGLFQMLIPQIVESLGKVKDTLPANVERFSLWLQKVLSDNPDIEPVIMEIYNQAYTTVKNWISNFDVVSSLGMILSGVSSSVWSLLMLVKNLLIGLIVMIYLLNIKDLLVAQAKKITYGALPLKWANAVVEEMRLVHRMFGGFIIGKLLDSLIIGIICFAGTSMMDMPYPLLLSVIIGVTNVIPFFGPFIGAVPTGFLVLLVSPVKCIYFLLFILVLQQFDGNILGPKILGDSTGLSSFWVLFSILLFGGLFGFAGMIIGVPAFAVIYDLISRAVGGSLKKKTLSTETADYMGLDHIDEDNKTFIK